MGNIKVLVDDSAYEDLKPEEVQGLQDFLNEMKGVANSLGSDSTPEDLIRALDAIGVVEIMEMDQEDGMSSIMVKKTLN
jgi:hypothetical protein